MPWVAEKGRWCGSTQVSWHGGAAVPALSGTLRLSPLPRPPRNAPQNLVRGSALFLPLGPLGVQRGRLPGWAPVLLCSSAVKLLWDIGQRALLLLTWHLSPSLSSLLPVWITTSRRRGCDLLGLV